MITSHRSLCESVPFDALGRMLPIVRFAIRSLLHEKESCCLGDYSIVYLLLTWEVCVSCEHRATVNNVEVSRQVSWSVIYEVKPNEVKGAPN